MSQTQKTAKKNQFTSFEKDMQELESIVNELESGEANLADTLKLYEKGVTLSRKCSGILAEAEQKVFILKNDIQEPDDIPKKPASKKSNKLSDSEDHEDSDQENTSDLFDSF